MPIDLNKEYKCKKIFTQKENMEKHQSKYVNETVLLSSKYFFS